VYSYLALQRSLLPFNPSDAAQPSLGCHRDVHQVSRRLGVEDPAAPIKLSTSTRALMTMTMTEDSAVAALTRSTATVLMWVKTKGPASIVVVAGPAEIGPTQIGFAKVRALQRGVAQIGVTQIGHVQAGLE